MASSKSNTKLNWFILFYTLVVLEIDSAICFNYSFPIW